MTEYSLLVDNTGNNVNLGKYAKNNREINSLYLFNLYYYYYHKGYSNLIVNEIINLGVLIYTVFLLIFLVQCVNFIDLMKYETKERVSISNFVNIHNFWNFNPFIIICSIIFIGYVIIRLISIYASMKKFWQIRKIYHNELQISNEELNTLTWNEVANKIIKCYCYPNLNQYTMALKIMTKENLIISIYNQLEELKFNKFPLTKLLEWNFIFCFINPLINENREISDSIKIDRNSYVSTVNSKLKIISVINLVFMPFLLVFMILYMILQYGEQFYNNPKLIVNRQWSLKALWKLRYYNELPHLFNIRIEKAAIATKEYQKQFPSRLYETISHFITFVMGSVFMILLGLTLLNENLLINLDISFNRPILWYMGIIGGILTISKTFGNNNSVNDPEKYIKKIGEHISLSEEWLQNCRQSFVKDELIKLFPQRVLLLIEECYCLLLTPYILWFVLKKESPIICDYLINTLTTHHSVNGLINKNSLFINYTQIKENQKTEKSFEYFQKTNPECNFLFFVFNQDTYYPQTNVNTIANSNNIESGANSINNNQDKSIDIKPSDILLKY
jgi:autophagy-related protein 9